MATTHATPISLEQLIALNDEIAALVRAGIPLELGLDELAADSGEALGRISSQLSERMRRGESLPQALAAEGNRFPRAYRAVVEAGLKAGRLPAALEAVSSLTGQMLEFRRKIGLAALYPLAIVAVAYVLFLVFLAEMVARYESAYQTFRLPPTWWLETLAALRDGMAVWGWIPPLLLLAVIVWFVLSGRRAGAGFSSFPFVGVKQFRTAMFADLLAMQVDHGIPLPEGIVLSAEATGSPAMRQSAQALSEHLSQGGELSSVPAEAAAIPPFLRWLMVDGQRRGRLAPALRPAAQMYRRRALNALNWFKVLFPVLMALLVGGGVAALYALGLFVPFIEMLQGLSGADMLPPN